MEREIAGFSEKEIEEATLSAIMQWQECLDLARQHNLSQEHFSVPHHRTLYSHCCAFRDRTKTFDLLAFTEQVQAAGEIAACGGPAELTRIWMNVCHSPKIMPFYLEILEDRHAKRKVLEACSNTLASSEWEGATLKADALGMLQAIPDPASIKPRKTFAQIVDEQLEQFLSGKPAEDVLPTGLVDLDRISPLRRGDMALIAGERKAGKTILALSIILNIARRSVPVLFFSLEDRQAKVIERLLHACARKGILDRQSTLRASHELVTLPLHIRDDVYDLAAIAAVSREAKAMHEIGLIVIDYAQLVRSKTSKDRRELEVAEVSRTLRLLAMELNTPLILLSQLNAEGQTRESRSLEQDATAMWMIKMSEHGPGQRLILIPWQRNGESGRGFEVAFLGDQARVETLAKDNQP